MKLILTIVMRELRGAFHTAISELGYTDAEIDIMWKAFTGEIKHRPSTTWNRREE